MNKDKIPLLEKSKVAKIPRKKPGFLRRLIMRLSGNPYVPFEKIKVRQGHIDGLMSVDIDEF
jgi:hypothetical protein